ncbi:mechanosensitive ion channel domain-containing protein [Algoriphagus chordae]|nr:mechanosensitive ion channel domain-containing protein [Algoriphagus chordae]
MTRAFLVILCTFLFAFASLAQNDSVPIARIDSTAKDSSKVVKAPSINSLDSLFVFDDTTRVVKQSRHIGTILTQVINRAQNHAIEISKIKLELADVLDTLEMSNQLPKVKLFAEKITEQTEGDQDKFNLRYLQGMDNLIVMVKGVNEKFDSKLKSRIATLTDAGIKLEKIKSDSVFNMTLRDTTLLPAINKELSLLKKAIKSVDSTFLAQEIIMAKFQAKVSDNTVAFLELKQFLNTHRIQLEHQFWTKEINYIWEAPSFKKETNFQEVFLQSLQLNIMLLKVYWEKDNKPFILALLVLIGIYFAMRYAIKSISEEKEFASLILNRTEYFQKRTFWSVLIILLPFYLIFFSAPPLVFISILSLLMAISSTFLVKKEFGNDFFRYWLIFLFPYIVLAYNGLHWKIAFQERWYILISSLIFIVMGCLIWRSMKDKETTAAYFLKTISILLVLMQSFAFFANIFGRFNLAKTYSVTGAITFYRAVSLYLFVQVFLEVVYLIIEYRKKENDEFTSYFDFQDLQKRMKGFVSIFAICLWVYGLLWHLGYYNYIYLWVTDFLQTPRVLGATEFQYGSILLFVIILYISTFLANNIAYFASIKDQKNAASRKQRLGSSILLIRLAIWIIGFFIGMTAAKIPFDKITIVLGALSVGIGFGLQTIINNLVSGVVLAFERPIQIGDEIQVGQTSGTVKDVGIRASKIQGYDGSEIVVPNGDLLSQSLINWTLSDKKRRVELIIGVGYSSDMKKVKALLEEVLNREHVLKTPNPHVYMQTFNDSSVDFRVLFWVESMDIWIQVRAEVMAAIFEKFAEHEIEIPFPKRDLYLKSVPSNWQEKISKPGEDISPVKINKGLDASQTDENKKSSEE